jgi:hypothetical protein
MLYLKPAAVYRTGEYPHLFIASHWYIFAKILARLEPAPSINFDNTEIAFSGKTNRELKWEYWLFKLMSSPALTAFFSTLARWSISLRLPVKWLIRKTVYDQFCGGETLAYQRCNRLWC